MMPMEGGAEAPELLDVAAMVMTDADHRFAAGTDGRLLDRYLLEAVIDLLSDQPKVLDFLPELAWRAAHDAARSGK